MTARRRIACLFAATPLLFATAASAEVAAPPDAAWDAGHMQSNFANRGAVTPRPAIEGLDADGRVASDPVVRTQVQEQWITINPHGWQPGAGSRNQTGAGRPFAKGTRFTAPVGATPHRSNAMQAQSSHVPSGRRSP